MLCQAAIRAYPHPLTTGKKRMRRIGADRAENIHPFMSVSIRGNPCALPTYPEDANRQPRSELVAIFTTVWMSRQSCYFSQLSGHPDKGRRGSQSVLIPGRFPLPPTPRMRGAKGGGRGAGDEGNNGHRDAANAPCTLRTPPLSGMPPACAQRGLAPSLRQQAQMPAVDQALEVGGDAQRHAAVAQQDADFDVALAGGFGQVG